MRKRNHAFLLLVIVLAWKWHPRIFIKKNKFGDRMIKQLLNSVIAKYRDLSLLSRRWVICSPLTNRDIRSTLSNNCLVNCFNLTPAMAALSLGCKPRIEVFDTTCYWWVLQPCGTFELFLYVTHFIFCSDKLQLTTYSLCVSENALFRHVSILKKNCISEKAVRLIFLQCYWRIWQNLSNLTRRIASF